MTTVNNICYHVTHRDQGSVELELPMAQAVQVSLSFCPSAQSLRHPLLLMFLHSGCIWGVYSHLQWSLITFSKGIYKYVFLVEHYGTNH